MALTQQQWFEKLKKFVPNWFFEEENLNSAHFQAIAKMLSERQTEVETIQGLTFLDNMTGTYLDLAGDERSVTRLTGESDNDYRERIRVISTTINYQSLFDAVERELNNGTPIFMENWAYGFFDDDLFYSTGDDCVHISQRKRYDQFTVIVPTQTGGDDNTIKAAIVTALDANKALGVFYDVLYQT